MNSITFEALSTKWQILIDQDCDSIDKLKTEILQLVNDFESKYSRFIPTSLVGRLNKGEKIEPDHTLDQMLEFGKKLEKISQGHFSLKVGKILGKLGYGGGDQDLDFGSFGKGWLIDEISKFLKEKEIVFFLISGGGDVFGTTKKNGDSWKVALEHPTDVKKAIGIVQIKDQALAASSSNKRSWKNDGGSVSEDVADIENNESGNDDTSHHLVDVKNNTLAPTNRAVFILAKNAKSADGVATATYVSPQELWSRTCQEFQTECLVISDNKITKSSGFVAELW
jgi:thiamine biosynthesis lipoprotein ApbE